MDQAEKIEALRAAIKSQRSEIYALAAETSALQHILVNLLCQIGKVSPNLSNAVEVALNDAASTVENSAIRHSKTASPDHLIKALRVVEELRAATLGNKKKPRDGV